MSWGGFRALLVAGVAVVCVCVLEASAQSGGSSSPGGGNPFPGDTNNVPVMPSRENPNPPAAPAPGAGQDAGQSPGSGGGSGAGAAGGTNQFPGDTGNVPVMPSKGTPALPERTYRGDDAAANIGLPNDDADPVKSPDDPVAESTADRQGFSSSNIPGLDKIIDKADDEDQQAAKKKERSGDKYGVSPAEHKETPGEDIEVGKFEMERKNWKAALSRFESALVLSPEDPEVYWGLAESERRLGQFAEARANYKKLLDYDPDGPHGKAARKALSDPLIANAQAAAPVAEAGAATKH